MQLTQHALILQPPLTETSWITRGLPQTVEIGPQHLTIFRRRAVWREQISRFKTRSPLISQGAVGGPDQDRTDDLCIANAALSQLSYRPKKLQFIGLLNWVNGAA